VVVFVIFLSPSKRMLGWTEENITIFPTVCFSDSLLRLVQYRSKIYESFIIVRMTAPLSYLLSCFVFERTQVLLSTQWSALLSEVFSWFYWVIPRKCLDRRPTL